MKPGGDFFLLMNHVCVTPLSYLAFSKLGLHKMNGCIVNAPLSNLVSLGQISLFLVEQGATIFFHYESTESQPHIVANMVCVGGWKSESLKSTPPIPQMETQRGYYLSLMGLISQMRLR